MNHLYEMRLRPEPFGQICSGEKTIEYRLHDEKRSALRRGDYIRFTRTTDGSTVLAEIIDLFAAPSFDALERKLTESGVLAVGSFSPAEMRAYYSAREEEQYGVLGIQIRVVDPDANVCAGGIS